METITIPIMSVFIFSEGQFNSVKHACDFFGMLPELDKGKKKKRKLKEPQNLSLRQTLTNHL